MMYSVKEIGKMRYVNSLINKVKEVVRILKLDDEINNKIKKFIYILYINIRRNY